MFRRWRREKEPDEELRNHLDLEAEELSASRVQESEPRLAARLSLGNVTQVKEAVRETWGFTRLEQFVQDLRFGLRTFRANANLALTIVIPLGLGIGGTCAMFSVIYGVLIDPYVYDSPQEC